MEYAILFDSGVWIVMEKPAGGSSYPVDRCPSFETAVAAISFRIGRPVLVKTITPIDY